jgi:hypothetical protein
MTAAGGTPQQAILLGNGFSQAYNIGLFSYTALQSVAALPPRLNQVFTALGTTDFELVMRRLSQSALLMPPYNVPAVNVNEMQADIDTVRTTLITALTAHHPANADSITPAESQTCAAFFAPFKTIFTLNYDLLLYWVIVAQMIGAHDDGFRGWGVLQWQGPHAPGQTVYYLHGALHMYDTGSAVHKIVWNNTGVPILTQLDASMRAGNFPLFVSEGLSAQKLARIRSNQYLLDAYEELSTNFLPLTTYGVSFSAADQHIVDALARSKTPHITVVIFDGVNPAERTRIETRARAMAAQIRLGGAASCSVAFVNSSTLRVWR